MALSQAIHLHIFVKLKGYFMCGILKNTIEYKYLETIN